MAGITLKVDDRLLLRQFEDRDAEELFQLVDRNRSYLREWMPWVDGTRSTEDIRGFFRRCAEKADAERAYTFGACYEDRLVGVIGQHYIDSTNRKTEIGYWLDASHQRFGIMTRATAHLIDFAFDAQGCHRIVIHCATGNIRSRAIPKRLGFVQEGVLREAEWLYDHFVDLIAYAMLKKDWRLWPNES